MSVVIETTLGDMTVDLYINERPRTCLNFLKLCKIKYYNYCVFHNVQRNFIAQTGDPTGSGRGGGSVFHLLYGEQAKFFEAEKIPKIKHKRAGLLSMVNDGNGFHGSQFLITMAENLDSLDGEHTVFGEVAEGMETVMKISEAFCDKDNRPYQDIRITHTVILDDPLDDPPGLSIPDRSPEPTEDQVEGCFRIGADEAIVEDEGLDEKVIKEKEEKKEAQHSAQVLEIIGDLPDKDVKPPDNVLFVCKLNSITTDEDLEIIFSRFGTILSCEIIRDYKTGDSLQYAFIEFEEAEMCEKAYAKMDNVLIDDRRIHVDFSQSVSNMNYRRHNKGGNPPPSTKPPPPDSSPRKKRHERVSPTRDNRRHRDVTPPRRHRDVTPPRRHKKTKNSEQSRDNRRHNDRHPPQRHQQCNYDESRSYSRHSAKHRGDVTPERKLHQNKRQSPIRGNQRETNDKKIRSRDSSSRSPIRMEKKRKKSKKEKKMKKRRKYSNSGSSSESDLSSEKEVRCGKHKKRSVSNHKDDSSRRRRS